MWRHDTKKTKICLFVDDFEIKYFNDEDAHHSLKMLQKEYSITVDMERKHFCGLEFDFNHEDGYVNIKIINYVSDALNCF